MVGGALILADGASELRVASACRPRRGKSTAKSTVGAGPLDASRTPKLSMKARGWSVAIREAAKTGVIFCRRKRAQQKQRSSAGAGTARGKTRGHLRAQEGCATKTEIVYWRGKGAEQKRGPSFAAGRARGKNGGHLCAKKGRVAAPGQFFGCGKVASPLQSHSFGSGWPRRHDRACLSHSESPAIVEERSVLCRKTGSCARSGATSVPVKSCPFAYCPASFSAVPAKASAATDHRLIRAAR